MKQNALLRRDEWLQIDAAVLDTVKTGLVGIADLYSNGLVFPLGGLGVMLSAYEKVGEMTEADVSMDADVPGQEDTVAYDAEYVPVPIIHKDFRISARKLASSRRVGESLDTTNIRAAARVVREKMETMLFSGLTKPLAGYPIYGYTNHPFRNTGTAFGDFGTAGNGFKTVQKAITQMTALGINGPFQIYLHYNQYSELLNLLGANADRTELSVILDQMPAIAGVKVSYDMTDGEMLMIHMANTTVDLAVGEDVRTVQWGEMGGFIAKYRVMTALVPRIKVDANNVTGILHYTGC